MPHDPAKLYEDILRAIADVQSFCTGKTMADFEADRQCQLAVEGDWK